MPSRELPARPNLEQLKKQAKSLLAEAGWKDRDAQGRLSLKLSENTKAAGH